MRVLELAALKGLFADVVEDPVSYVNAPLLAAERGVEVRLATDPDSPDYRNLITLRGTLADGTQVSVSGTLTGVRQSSSSSRSTASTSRSRSPTHLAVLRYEDRPGIVGTVGRILGEADVNIAGMQVSRDRKGGQALVAMTVDSAIPPAVLDDIAGAVQADTARTVDLEA